MSLSALKPRNSKVYDFTFYILVGLVYSVLIYLSGRYVFSVESFWYDESGQFFIAKGLNHASKPYASPGSLLDVIYSNAHFNQDPGGFSIILYFWTLISNNPVWLRFLPFIFFLAAIVFFCLITKKIIGNNKLAVVSGLFVFALIQGQQAFLLRPYSMELCAVLVGIWLVLWMQTKISIKRAFLAGLLMSVCITARYSMVVVGFVLSCAVLFFILRSKTAFKNKLWIAFAYSLPLLVTVACIYVFSMSLQNPDAKPLGYIRYIEIWSWIECVPLALNLVLLCTWKWQNSQTRTLILITLAINVIFLVLGSLKMLPWTIYNNRGQIFVVLTYLMAFNAIVTLLKAYLKILPIIALLAACGTIVYVNRTFGSTSIDGCWWNDIAGMLREVYRRGYTNVYVTSHTNPNIRYLFEEGCLKDSASVMGYPQNFKLFEVQEHCMASSNQYGNLMISEVDSINRLPIGSIVIDDFSWNASAHPDYVKIGSGIYQRQK